MAFSRTILSLDIGTSRTRLIVPHKGLAVDEPTVAIQNVKTGELVRFGELALQARLQRNERVLRPFKKGVIAEFQSTAEATQLYLQQSLRRFQFVKPDLILTVSGAASSSEQRALIEAVPKRLIRRTYPLPAVYAAAIGAGVNIAEPRGCMIIHLGGGVTEVAIISLGQTIHDTSLRFGGIDLDEALAAKIKRLLGVKLSESVIDEIKTSYLTMDQADGMSAIRRTGLSADAKTHKKVIIHNSILRDAIEPFLDRIVTAARQAFEATTPELVSDIWQSGILLTGGGAQLHGLPEYLTKKLKTNCVVASEPALCAVRGANLATTYLADYQRSLD